jgi:hypothetical protein
MNAYASPLLLPFALTAFLVFAAAGVIATRAFGRGRAAAGLRLLAVVWLIGTAAVTLFGYPQYGLRVALPAAVAVGISVAVLYAITSRGSRQSDWRLAAARGGMAAVTATVLLLPSLLLLLVLFGIDGP